MYRLVISHLKLNSFPHSSKHGELTFCLNRCLVSWTAVLVLFGILPAAMSWSDRSSSSEQSPRLPYLVPGGKLTLSLIIGGAGCVILSELLENFGPGHP